MRGILPARPGPRTAWTYLSRTAAGLVALAALANLLGFARDAVLAAWYGASPSSDAFFVGSFVPLLIQQVVVVGTLVPAFLPVLMQTAAPDRGPAPPARRLVGAMAGLAGGLGLLLCAGLVLAAPALIGLVAPGLPPAAAAQATTVLRLGAPLVLFVAPAGVLGAALNARGRFGAPALGAAATNAGVVLALGLGGRAHGLEAAAAGMSAGALLGLLIVAGAARRDFGSGPDQKSVPLAPGQVVAGLRRTALLAGPLLATVGLVQAIAVVERYLGSQLAPGSLSLLAYAMKLNLLPVVILAGSVTTVAFPALSQHAQAATPAPGAAPARPATAAFTAELARGITGVLTWTLPAAIWLAVCAGPVLRLLYQRGLFSAADSQAAAAVLGIYAAGLVPLALLQLLPRAYHARQDMLLPLGLYALGLGAYLGLAPPLAAAGGAAGLAAAFSLESYLAAGLFLWGLWPDLRPVAGALLRTTARVLAAGLVLAGACAGWLRWGPAGVGDSVVDRAALVAVLAAGGLAVYVMAMTALSGGWGRVSRTPRPAPAIVRDPASPDPE